jgi:glutaredoxin 2
LKLINGLEDQLNKSKQIIKSIDDCLSEEKKLNRQTLMKMETMKDEWDTEGLLRKTFIRTSSVVVSPSTLAILKEKRLKIQALARMDN